MSIEKYMFKGMLIGMLDDITNDNRNPRREQTKAAFIEACKEIGTMNDVEICENCKCSAPELKEVPDEMKILKKIFGPNFKGF
jgi:hypothetical protein